MTIVSQAAYARHRKVAPATVNYWRKHGRVLEVANGQIDKEKSDEMLDARPEVYRGGRIGGGGAPSPRAQGTAQAIAMKETYLALTRRLEYERAVGRVCDIEAVEAIVASNYAVIRNRLMGLGAKVVPLLDVPNQEEAKNIIDAEVIRALTELSSHDVYLELKRGVDTTDAAADEVEVPET
jgi:hypothetical protein